MIHAVEYLALAYHLTGQEKYGTEAARFLRGFFLDAETKMNPHLDYGQSVPGKATGRGWGLIDTRVYDSARCTEVAGKVPRLDSERPEGNEGMVDDLWGLDADE